MERITRKNVTAAFERLAALFNKQTSPTWLKGPNGENIANVGAWVLSAHSPGDGLTRYGVEELDNEGGGVSDPLGGRRWLGAKEAYQCLDSAAKAVALAIGKNATNERLSRLYERRNAKATA